MHETALALRELSVGYRGPAKSVHTVAAGINLSLHAGELVCLLGPNGAGKSTLLRTAAAMQKPGDRPPAVSPVLQSSIYGRRGPSTRLEPEQS